MSVDVQSMTSFTAPQRPHEAVDRSAGNHGKSPFADLFAAVTASATMAPAAADILAQALALNSALPARYKAMANISC